MAVAGSLLPLDAYAGLNAIAAPEEGELATQNLAFLSESAGAFLHHSLQSDGSMQCRQSLSALSFKGSHVYLLKLH